MFSTALKVTPTSHLYRRMPLLQHIVALSVVSAIRTIPEYEVYRLCVDSTGIMCVWYTCDIPYIHFDHIVTFKITDHLKVRLTVISYVNMSVSDASRSVHVGPSLLNRSTVQ